MESVGLLSQLGINWKLFLSQAVNFFILLIILRAFVYKPLLAAIKKRNEKIKDGLQKAEEADVRLKEVDVIAKGKLQDAEQESIDIIKQTEARGKELEQSLKLKAEQKQQELMAQAQAAYLRQKEESKNLVFGQAVQMVKKIIAKTVELKPEAIDEALVNKAILQMKNDEK